MPIPRVVCKFCEFTITVLSVKMQSLNTGTTRNPLLKRSKMLGVMSIAEPVCAWLCLNVHLSNKSVCCMVSGARSWFEKKYTPPPRSAQLLMKLTLVKMYLLELRFGLLNVLKVKCAPPPIPVDEISLQPFSSNVQFSSVTVMSSV